MNKPLLSKKKLSLNSYDIKKVVTESPLSYHAIDPNTIQACYPSTILNGTFSLLCFQPGGVTVLFNALDTPDYSGVPIATQNLERARFQHSVNQTLYVATRVSTVVSHPLGLQASAA